MAEKKFSKREAIGFGWETTTHHLLFFVGLLIIVVVIYAVPNRIGGYISQWASQVPEAFQNIGFKILSIFASLIFAVAVMVLQLTAQLGCLKISLALCDGKSGRFADLFSCFPFVLKYLAGSILYGLIVVGGVFLLIVPGIIWAMQFQYYGYLIIDKGLGPVAALKQSSKLTKGVEWDLFLLGLLSGLILLLGVFVLFIGLFAAIPTTMIAATYVYRKLSTQAEEVKP